MPFRLKAVYQEGVFIPRERCEIPEGSEVELIIQGPLILPHVHMSTTLAIVTNRQRQLLCFT